MKDPHTFVETKTDSEKPKQMCWYCRTERPEAELKRATLIPHPKQPELRGPHWFCADKPCHTYAQYSLEG